MKFAPTITLLLCGLAAACTGTNALSKADTCEGAGCGLDAGSGGENGSDASGGGASGGSTGGSDGGSTGGAAGGTTGGGVDGGSAGGAAGGAAGGSAGGADGGSAGGSDGGSDGGSTGGAAGGTTGGGADGGSAVGGADGGSAVGGTAGGSMGGADGGSAGGAAGGSSGGAGGGSGGAAVGGQGGAPDPGNLPPLAVIDAPDVARAGAVVTLDGSQSVDPEGQALTFRWSQIAGSPVELDAAEPARATFVAPDTRDALVFQLQVEDAGGLTAEATGTVLVGNHAPIADAGIDLVAESGEAVTLDGTGSRDPDGDAVVLSWRQVSGPNVLLDDPLSPRPGFTAPAARSAVVFELSVDDGLVTSTDQVTVNVANRPPVADAGGDRVAGRLEAITLQGRIEDPDGDVLTSRWTQIAGVPVTLDDDTRLDPTFLTADRRGSVTFELIAYDGAGESAPDTVTVTVDDIPPTADAGPDQLDVPPGALLRLEGSGEDLDGDPLTFRWTQTQGPAVDLSDTRSATPTFVAPDRRVTLEFVLVVDDGAVASRPDAVRVTVANTPPVSRAGDDSAVAHGAAVTLDGSASFDADGDNLSWRWLQTGGAPVALVDTDGPRPSFMAPMSRDVLTFQLIVNDGLVDGGPDTVDVVILNGAPLADAGEDDTVDGDHDVDLDGRRSSDPDGDALNYFWTQVEGTPVQLEGRATSQPRFRSPLPRQRLRFSLTVNDGDLASEPDEVIVDVRNHAPTANAGQNQDVDREEQVQLFGTGSDLDGDALTFTWRQVRGQGVQLSDTHAAQPTFRAPNSETRLEFELIVNDGFVNSAPDVVSIDVGGN